MVYARFSVSTSSTVPGTTSRRCTPPSTSDWTMLPFAASLRCGLGWKSCGAGRSAAVFIIPDSRVRHNGKQRELVFVLDIAIIGGGPAGSTAGRLLAQWGYSVGIYTEPRSNRPGL